MKLRISMETDVDHENMAILFNIAVAATLKRSLTDAGLELSEVWPFVESATFDLAMLFDQGTFEVNGRVFRPRVSFVSENGNVLPGSVDFDRMHDYGAVQEDDLKPQKGFSLRV